MNQPALKLCGTVGIITADCRFIALFYGRCTADGTYIGNTENLVSAFLGNGKHLGNNVARFTDNYRIADCYLLFINKVLIVQGCTADGCTRKLNGVKNGCGSEHTRSADIDFNLTKHRRLFLGRIFERNRPTGEFCRTAERLTLCKIVNLYYCAVNIKGQSASHFTDFTHLLNGRVKIGKELIIGHNLKAELPEKIK